MKKIVTAGLLLASMSGAALAADLPARVAPIYTAPPVPVFTWTGPYFGINAGYAFDHDVRYRNVNVSVPTPQVARLAQYTQDSSGFTGGGQIGYNYQIGGFGGQTFGVGGMGVVVGVEADAAYTDLTRTSTVNALDLTNGLIDVPNRYRSSLDFLGTVRGRVGLAFNQFLIYGTGGFAYGGVYNSVTYFAPGGGVRFFGNRNRIETGYAYGGGVEYALPTNSLLNFFKSSAVTLKVEYLRYDLGTQAVSLPAVTGGGGTGLYQSRISTDGNIIRAGLNYKFGSF